MPPPFKYPKARRPKQKKQGLPKIFNCVNCSSSNSVMVELDRKIKVAKLVCKVCNERFSTVIHGLSAEVDVYGEWIEVYSNREDGMKEPHTERLTIKETSKNRLTARQSGNVLPKTKEPDVESAGPNSRTADILVSERPAPINGSKDGNPNIKKSVTRPRDTVSTKEHFTKRATIEEHSNNGSTAQLSDSKLSKTKDPGPNGHTAGILAAERPASISGPKENNPSTKRSVIRQRKATQPSPESPTFKQLAANSVEYIGLSSPTENKRISKKPSK